MYAQFMSIGFYFMFSASKTNGGNQKFGQKSQFREQPVSDIFLWTGLGIYDFFHIERKSFSYLLYVDLFHRCV